MIDLSGYDLVCLDTEGDGNAPPEPIEISIAAFDMESIVSVSGWRLNPGTRISPYATRVHGLRNADVRGCPKFGDVADEIRSSIEGKMVVGHAVHNDMHILRRKLPDLVTGPVVDTQKMAKQLSRGHASLSLHNLTADLGIEVPSTGRGKHSADYDTRLTVALFRYLSGLDGAAEWFRAAGVRPHHTGTRPFR